MKGLEIIDEADVNWLLDRVQKIYDQSPRKEQPAIKALLKDMKLASERNRVAPKEAFQEMTNILAASFEKASEHHKPGLFTRTNYIDSLNHGGGKKSDRMKGLTLKEIFKVDKFQRYISMAFPEGVLNLKENKKFFKDNELKDAPKMKPR